MPFYENRYIHTRNAQGPRSDAPLVIRYKEPTFSSGSEDSEDIDRIPTWAIERNYDIDLVKEVEDFVESVRREIIQREIRRIPATNSWKRKSAPLYTHPNGRMAMADADAVHNFAR